MTEKKEYRNAVRSRRMIREAFVALLHEKPFEKITATDIINRSGLNRSTFYAHYEDISALMLEIEDEVLEHVTVYADGFNDYSDKKMLEVFEEFFDYVKGNAKIFRVLVVQHDDSNFNRRMLDVIMEKYKMSIECNGELPAKYTYIYSVSGVIGIMGEWISSDFAISSKQLSKMVWQLCVKANRNL